MITQELGNIEAEMNVEQEVLTEQGQELTVEVQPSPPHNDEHSAVSNCEADEKGVEDEPLAKELGLPEEKADERSRDHIEVVISNNQEEHTVALTPGVIVDAEDSPSTVCDLPDGSDLPSVSNEPTRDDSSQMAASSGRKRTKKSRSWKKNTAKSKLEQDFEELQVEESQGLNSEKPEDHQEPEGIAREPHAGQNAPDLAQNGVGEGREAQLESMSGEGHVIEVHESGPGPLDFAQHRETEGFEDKLESICEESHHEVIQNSGRNASYWAQQILEEGDESLFKSISEVPRLEDFRQRGKSFSDISQRREEEGAQTQLQSICEEPHLEPVQGTETVTSGLENDLVVPRKHAEEQSFLNLRSRSLGRWADVSEDIESRVNAKTESERLQSQDIRADGRSNQREQDRAKFLQGREAGALTSRELNWRRRQAESRGRQEGLRNTSKMGVDGDNKKDEQQDFRSRIHQGTEPQATHKNWVPRRGLQSAEIEGRVDQHKTRGKAKQGRETGPQNQNTKDFGRQSFEAQNQFAKDFARQKFEADLKIKQEELLQKSRQSLRAEFQKAKRIEQTRKGRDELEMELNKNLVYEDGELFFLNP